jgi:adenylate cyclase
VAEFILSDGFSPEGFEVDVSILFCDVRDFTRFAAEADPQEVVSRLNAQFETVVPVIARHGGHVDKFVGDGLLAVFGAPESYPDHADRGVRCAVEMAEVVNHGDSRLLPIGVGVNSGRVVAGSIGGGGRLNYSVIGDAVNVASRVESVTRESGDDVLLTSTTRELLSHTIRGLPAWLLRASRSRGAGRAVRAERGDARAQGDRGSRRPALVWRRVSARLEQRAWPWAEREHKV